MTGMVTLVGAGPGSRALLTLAGAEAIRRADAVVYDRLVDTDILTLIPCGAERIDVGKRAGVHPVPQEEINAILVRLAQAGKIPSVLRAGTATCLVAAGRNVNTCMPTAYRSASSRE